MNELQQAESQAAKDNFAFFRKRVCNYRDFQDFHKPLDNVLLSSSRYKLIKIPRNHLKSSDVMAFVLFKILHNPNISVLYESSIYAQAKKYLGEMKNHLESDRWKSLFGSWIGLPWTDSQITINRRTQSQVAPTLSASGLDKTQTGQHYDLIILDDLVDELNSRTHEGRQKAIDRYRQALSLLRPAGTIILIGTPWDREDLYGWIEANPKIKGMFETFHMDVYDSSGAIVFKEKFCETTQEEKDHPNKRSLESLRLQLGAYAFSCQYRCNPEAEDFSEFKRTWLKHSTVAHIEQRLRENRGKIWIFCDPAMGKEVTKNPCDTAIVVGHFMASARADVLEEEVGRFTPADTVLRLHKKACKYALSGDCEVSIEDVGFQGTMITQLEELRNRDGIYYQISPCKPVGDKDRRIRNTFIFYQNGQITHSDRVKGGKLEDQLYRFPKDKLKDVADAWSQFCLMANFPSRKAAEIRFITDIKPVFYSKRVAKQSDTKKKTTYSDKPYLGGEGDMFGVGM